MHNPVNSAISFGILAVVVGGSFFYVSANVPPKPWTGILAGGIISQGAPEELRQGQDHGFLIIAIAPSSPADRAGLRGGGEETIIVNGQAVPIGGDIILSMDGRQIKQRTDVCIALEEKQIGDTVVFKVAREGSIIEANVVLEDLPQDGRTFC